MLMNLWRLFFLALFTNISVKGGKMLACSNSRCLNGLEEAIQHSTHPKWQISAAGQEEVERKSLKSSLLQNSYLADTDIHTSQARAVSSQKVFEEMSKQEKEAIETRLKQFYPDDMAKFFEEMNDYLIPDIKKGDLERVKYIMNLEINGNPIHIIHSKLQGRTFIGGLKLAAENGQEHIVKVSLYLNLFKTYYLVFFRPQIQSASIERLEW